MHQGDEGAIQQGSLLCSHPECRSEYPIIDGIPILVADLRKYISENLVAILGRDDLPADTESLIGDCCGPGSLFDAQRQHLSTYAFDHYADLDPNETPDDHSPPGAILRLLNQALEGLGAWPAAPLLDLGCSVGRSTFELAQHTHEPVLGMDLNFNMLRMASEILNRGIVRYPKRRVGIVYERREFPVRFPQMEQVDFWVGDALAPPFAPGGFGGVFSLNLLDCLPEPYRHLHEIARLLVADGKALLATPFDWNQNATPMEAWIGGHSQRAETRGLAEPLLRTLLTPGEHPQAVAGLELVGEPHERPWSLRLHDRSTMQYRVHCLALRKTA